jgi:hypothetical protein
MDGHSKVNPVATIFLLQTMDKSKLIYSISAAKFLSTMKTKRSLIQICRLGAVACLNPLRRAAEVVSKQWNVINPPATSKKFEQRINP